MDFEKIPGYKFQLDLRLPKAVVPCGGCTLCCKKTPVMLIEEVGDDVSSYDHVVGPDGRSYLRLLDNGDCTYLGDGGCTIHERVPYACRVFDCRRLFSGYTRKERRELIRRGGASKEILERGRELLGQEDK